MCLSTDSRNSAALLWQGVAWRGVARKELREEGREERARLLQLERVERPTLSSSVPSQGLGLVGKIEVTFRKLLGC